MHESLQHPKISICCCHGVLILFIIYLIFIQLCIERYRNICECKNYEPDFNLKRSHSDCTSPCTENPSEYCGGGVTLQNIYKTLFSGTRRY